MKLTTKQLTLCASSEEIPLRSVPACGEDYTRFIPSSSPHWNRCAGFRRGPLFLNLQKHSSFNIIHDRQPAMRYFAFPSYAAFAAGASSSFLAAAGGLSAVCR